MKLMICVPLLFDIMGYRALIPIRPHGAREILVCPDLSASELFLHPETPFEYFPGANTFDDRHYSEYIVGWNGLN